MKKILAALIISVIFTTLSFGRDLPELNKANLIKVLNITKETDAMEANKPAPMAREQVKKEDFTYFDDYLDDDGIYDSIKKGHLSDAAIGHWFQYNNILKKYDLSRFDYTVLRTKISIGYQKLLEGKYNKKGLPGYKQCYNWGKHFIQVTITETEKETLRPYMDEIETVIYKGKGYDIIFHGWHIDPPM